MDKEQEKVKDLLDELIWRVQIKAYFMGYERGYEAGSEK